jgi:hypothetical protein
MIQSYGRLICVFAIVALWVPLTVNLMNPVGAPLVADNRTIAKLPARPADILEWLQLSRDMESYVNDNFGFRHQMVAAYSTLRFVLRSPNVRGVAFGENGWMFYTGDKSFQQSRGQILREERIRAFADLAAELDALISARGGRLLVAIPPNQHTIEFENLPSWALRFDGPTEYDALMKMLAERDVGAIDLRPILLAGKATGPVYRPRDTHWSNFGALLAFNAIAKRLGNGAWIIDPASVYRGTKEEIGGLSKMAGVPTIFMDTEAEVTLNGLLPSDSTVESLNDFPPFSTYILTTSSGGEPVTIIGDSFTRLLLRDYFAASASRVLWTDFRFCEFDWNLIANNLPSTVLLMPNERYLGCDLDKFPRNLPPR